MQAEHTSADLQILDEAILDAWKQTGLDRAAILKYLNDNGWFLVTERELAPRFTSEELDAIRQRMIPWREANIEELRVRIEEGSWGELAGPSESVALAEQVLTKIGYQ